MCRAAFHTLDIDNDNALTSVDLQAYLNKTQDGNDLKDSYTIQNEISSIFRTIDGDGDSRISFEEFMACMKDEKTNFEHLHLRRPRNGKREARVSLNDELGPER